MLRFIIAPFVLLSLIAPTMSAADCPGDPGFELLITPADVPIGTNFEVTIKAPQGSLAIMLLSGTPGPTVTPFGSLCVGFPLAGTVAIPIFAPVITFPHLVACDTMFVGLQGHFQYIAVDPAKPGVVAVSNSQSLKVIDGACSAVPDPGDFVSFTQGGWGTTCSGNNPGCLRDQNFDTVFPTGLVLGDQDGIDGDAFYAIVFDSSKAVQDFLPNGGTPAILSQDHLDPLATDAGVFASQLAAASLNLAFDDAGIFDFMKTTTTEKLKDLVFIAYVHPMIIGMTTAEVVALSHKVISGETPAPVDLDGDLVGDVTVSDLSHALDALNNDFDDGTSSNGSLAVPHVP